MVAGTQMKVALLEEVWVIMRERNIEFYEARDFVAGSYYYHPTIVTLLDEL